MLEALLVEKGARVDFERYEPAEPTLDGRIDLRELTTFTIDPDTAKDFDDALSFRREPDGIRSWVHIADVSYFVEAGTRCSTKVPPSVRSRPTCRASSRRCCRPLSPTRPARCGRTRTG